MVVYIIYIYVKIGFESFVFDSPYYSYSFTISYMLCQIPYAITGFPQNCVGIEYSLLATGEEYFVFRV